jgi:hypothetical protein
MPTSAISPSPTRSSSVALYAIHAPGIASADPSKELSV